MTCKFCGRESLRKSGFTRESRGVFVKAVNGIKLLAIIEKNTGLCYKELPN
jgi:hypothetical protein